jgi:hypothetical protein
VFAVFVGIDTPHILFVLEAKRDNRTMTLITKMTCEKMTRDA